MLAPMGVNPRATTATGGMANARIALPGALQEPRLTGSGAAISGGRAIPTGEVREWETSEYARDAIAQGRAKALIVTGHASSEEPGMEYLVEWLQPLVPGVPITHVPVGDAFKYL